MTTDIKSQTLGFIKPETVAIVEKLNLLLANYQIHYQKLRNFHWNVKGPEFFDIHEQFEAEYTQVQVNIDELAERIRIFGSTPYSTLASYLEKAVLKEGQTNLTSTEMVQEILSDFEVLLEYLLDAIEIAVENGDIGTKELLTKYVIRIEKRHWMFSAFISN